MPSQSPRRRVLVSPVSLAILFILALLPATTHAFSAFTILLKPHESHCFYDMLTRGDKLDIGYQVSEGGNLDIDFWVSTPAPDNKIIYSTYHQTTGSYELSATMDGKYTYCFSNRMSSVTDKVLSFTVQGPDERIKLDRKKDDTHEAVQPLEHEINQLADGLKVIRDQQAYMVVREKTHRNTAESSNSRVVFWSIFQTIMLVGVCFWQVFYLRRFFDVSNKRVV